MDFLLNIIGLDYENLYSDYISASDDVRRLKSTTDIL